MNYDDYKVTIPYPNKPSKPVMERVGRESQAICVYADAMEKWEKDMEDYQEALAIYREALRKLDERFKQDVLCENGLAGHPKAEKVWDLAWEEGHSSGYSEVANRVERLTELVKD